MPAFPGFPIGMRQLPVPAPMLGPVLVDITDRAELVCTLRFFWHQAQAKGFPRVVPGAVLASDDVLLGALGSAAAIARGFVLAVERGTLMSCVAADGAAAYALNTPEQRARLQAAALPAPGAAPAVATGAADIAHREAPPNVYTLYEQHIGLLTPMIADALRDAEATYPAEWIVEAVREAVTLNHRSWRYIQSILERWMQEGRGHGAATRPADRPYGKPGGHPQTLTAAEYRRLRRAAPR